MVVGGPDGEHNFWPRKARDDKYHYNSTIIVDIEGNSGIVPSMRPF